MQTHTITNRTDMEKLTHAEIGDMAVIVSRFNPGRHPEWYVLTRQDKTDINSWTSISNPGEYLSLNQTIADQLGREPQLLENLLTVVSATEAVVASIKEDTIKGQHWPRLAGQKIQRVLIDIDLSGPEISYTFKETFSPDKSELKITNTLDKWL